MSPGFTVTEKRQRQWLELASRLIEQENARVIVPAASAESGSWFGGGNVWQDEDGVLWLVGRYRLPGDSRTGVSQGTRGFALALFRSDDGGATFHKVWQRTKEQLAPPGCEVLSIEGAVLVEVAGRVELLVSSEKALAYPAPVAAFQKPGTGVWTIDRFVGDSPAALEDATAEPWVSSTIPEVLHVKDPFVIPGRDGRLQLGICTHPFNWTSSNTVVIPYPDAPHTCETAPQSCVARGLAWDVAIHRWTCVVPVDRVQPECDAQLVFFDGGECVRQLDEHEHAVSRPRGYSCEELGGVGIMESEGIESFRRLSRWFPQFISPYGTGCSRYVDVLATDDFWLATWQQSQPDRSQPLVAHCVSTDEIRQRVNDILRD